MDKKTAQALLRLADSAGKPFNDATLLIQNIESKEEQQRLRKAIADVWGIIYAEIMLPIFKQYPELDTEKK